MSDEHEDRIQAMRAEAVTAEVEAARVRLEAMKFAQDESIRPFTRMLPSGQLKFSIDGNQWCVLLGENLQDGVAGFGSSPEEASRDFDREWLAKLPRKGVENE